MKRTALTALAIAALLSCKGDQVVVYDAYEGPPPYPNTRTPLALPAGDVGLVTNSLSDGVTVIDLGAGKVLTTEPVGRDPVDVDGPHHIAADSARKLAYVALSYPPPTEATGPHASHGSSTRPGFVQKLSLEDLRVVGEVRVDENPGDIVMSDDGSRIVVSHYDLKRALSSQSLDAQRATLAVLDPSKILPSGSADPTRITVCVAPHGVALSRPDGRYAYVACYGEDAIAIVDLVTTEVTRVPLGGGGSPGRPVRGPYSAVLSPSGKRLVVGNTESKDLRFLDVEKRALEALFVATQGAPFFPAFTRDEATLFVPTQAPDSIAAVDASTGQKLRQRAFDDGSCIKPHEAVLSSDEATLYVVCEGDHKAPSVVLALDPATLQTKSRFDVGVYPDRLLLLGAKR